MDYSKNVMVKNMAYLYLRTFITLLISLYTSRVFLDALGIINYGIYNAVGGVVGMLAFFNGALAGSTSRFLTFELGKGNMERLQKTFKAAFTLHIILIIGMLIIFETAGLWFINYKLNIPHDNMWVINIVYQLSVLSALLGIFIVPFNASIISHERMTLYAYLGIFDSLLRLVISFAIVVSPIDKLLFYASLLFLVSLLDTFVYVIYCKRNFGECVCCFTKDKYIIKPIFSYSMWDLFGNFSVVVRSQGLVIIQNIFFGPVINAATAIANQVMGAIMGFVENFLTAVKPQIVKLYACNEVGLFNSLIVKSSKFSFLLLFFISFPIFIEARHILGLWLVDVPDYTVAFCQLSIANNWISILYRPIVVAIGATGNMKRISIINGSIYLLVLPLSYFFLKMGGSPTVPFITNLILLAIGHTFFSMRTIKLIIPTFEIIRFFKYSLLPAIYVVTLASIVPLIVYFTIQSGVVRFFINVVATMIWLGVIILFVALDKSERNLLYEYLGKIIKKTSFMRDEN